MVKRLGAKDKAAIEQAVAQAESRTSAEIAIVIANAGDDYAFAALSFGLITGTLLALLAHYLRPLWHYSILLWLQLAIMLLCVTVPILRHACLYFLPRRYLHQKAIQRAAAEYMRLTEKLPAGIPAMLIYLSLRERYIHIYASREVREKIADAEWDATVQTLTSAIRAQGLQVAVIDALAHAAEMLTLHFPADVPCHSHANVIEMEE